MFFSHQWTGFKHPDPKNHQYQSMVSSLRELAKRNNWDESLDDVFVWVDYSCIPQANASVQNLAIRSLAVYASSATYFVICAPDTKHVDLDDLCDLTTYQVKRLQYDALWMPIYSLFEYYTQRRMWCRAEQVCHSMRNGTGKGVTKLRLIFSSS